MGIAQPLALRRTQLCGFNSFDPDDRVRAGNVGKLELIDASAGLLRRLGLRVIERSHILRAADALEACIRVIDALFAKLGPALFHTHGVVRHRGVSLPDHRRLCEDDLNVIHLRIGKAVHRLQLAQQYGVRLRARRLTVRGLAEYGNQQQRRPQPRFHGRGFHVR